MYGDRTTPSSERLTGMAAGVRRHARRAIVLVIGGTVLLLGIAMLVLPGPAFIVIPAGLAILSTEFLWARRLLKHVQEGGSRLFPRRSARQDTRT